MTSDGSIVCTDIGKRFDGRRVLDGVSLSVSSSEIFSLVGPSGAGKTTLLRILAALERPDAGNVEVLGMRAFGEPADDLRIRRSVGYVQQNAVMLSGTVEDNISAPLKLRNVEPSRISTLVEEASSKLGVLDILKKKAKRISGGEAQRVAFARALVHGPRVLLLDEFTANLDPANVEILERTVREFASSGGTALMASHNILQVKRLGTRVGILMDGRIVESGEVAKVFAHPESEQARRFLSGEMAW